MEEEETLTKILFVGTRRRVVRRPNRSSARERLSRFDIEGNTWSVVHDLHSQPDLNEVEKCFALKEPFCRSFDFTADGARVFAASNEAVQSFTSMEFTASSIPPRQALKDPSCSQFW